jgi:23S rRNA pseudouridine1911/1915/1917 synthase
VEKPEGLLSSPLETSKAKTALDIVSRYLERRNPGAKNRAALIHRLDRDTSGVMLFAKSPEAKKAMMENWAGLVLERRYSALVEGEIKAEGGRIDAPLRQNRGATMFVPSGEECRPEEGGRDLPALTEWRLLRSGSGYSLLDVSLETGRKNQIRAHLAHIGYPVAGDAKYGARTDPLRRLGLHARLIGFLHPFSGERLSFESPCPPAFTSIFRKSPSRFP